LLYGDCYFVFQQSRLQQTVEFSRTKQFPSHSQEVYYYSYYNETRTESTQ